MLPNYDFNHPLFKQRPFLIRLAKDHISLSEMNSDVIDFEVVRTTDLDIPVVYHVHYHFKSIIGIDENLHPVYGDHHVAELSLERPYPLEPCKVYMKTDVWHPNIKWDGRLKGRVCSNVDKLGIAFDLYGLVLWVGEILQYKNYHAKNEPPYPEDINVAEWVLNFAEPQGIVNKEKEIYVDGTPLLQYAGAENGEPVKKNEPTDQTVKSKPPIQIKEEPAPAPKVAEAPDPPPAPMQPDPAPEAETAPDPKPGKFKITIVKKQEPKTRPSLGFKIKPRK